MECKKYIIYALVDPRDNQIRYIGRSSSGLGRPQYHMSKRTLQKSTLKVHNWIKGLLNKDLRPVVSVLEEWDTTDYVVLDTAEIKWIKYYRELGCRLTNMTDGGSGPNGRILSDKHRTAIINSNRTRKISDETLKKMKIAANSRSKYKPKNIVQLSNGMIFEGYKTTALYLGCSKSHICTMIKQQLSYNGISAIIINKEK